MYLHYLFDYHLLNMLYVQKRNLIIHFDISLLLCKQYDMNTYIILTMLQVGPGRPVLRTDGGSSRRQDSRTGRILFIF